MKKKNSKLLSVIIIALLLLLASRFLGGETGEDIGIIGGADGPTSVIVSGGKNAEALPETDPEKEAVADTEEIVEYEEDFFGDEAEDELTVEEDGCYDSKDEVALYIHLYGHLPSNYISKEEAQKGGWKGGTLKKLFPGKAIGGDRFGNYEGTLPTAKGRKWTECDIDTVGKNSRGAKRIVFSNDGLIYYTEDHYETFELLYD